VFSKKLGRIFRVLTPAARAYKEQVAQHVAAARAQGLPKGPLRATLVYVSPRWYTQEGDIARKDVANREKLVMDAVFQQLRMEDSWVFHLVLEKVHGREEMTVLKLEPWVVRIWPLTGAS
jgi:Holliday junction resolvase RusA-like endonuclease